MMLGSSSRSFHWLHPLKYQQIMIGKPNSIRHVAGTNLPTYVFENARELATHVATIIAGVIRERNALGQQAVLGLPTGSTPVGVYRELVRMHREDNLSFSRVITFNLDEYFGLAA